MWNVFDDADNRQPWIVGTVQSDRESFADRVFIGEVAARHRFVDDCRAWGIGSVTFGEIPPGDDWYAQSMKEVWRDILPARHRSVVEIERATFDAEGIVSCDSTQGLNRAQAHPFDSGQRLDSADEFLKECRGLR